MEGGNSSYSAAVVSTGMAGRHRISACPVNSFSLYSEQVFSAFLLGTVIGFVILLLNYMVEVEYFRVDILGRITGHSWN